MVKFMAECYDAMSQPRSCIIPQVRFFSSIPHPLLTVVLLLDTRHMRLQEHRLNEKRIVLKQESQNILNYDIYINHFAHVTETEILHALYGLQLFKHNVIFKHPVALKIT
jgi:hypothetical protein